MNLLYLPIVRLNFQSSPYQEQPLHWVEEAETVLVYEAPAPVCVDSRPCSILYPLCIWRLLSLVRPPSSPKEQLESASAFPLDCSQIHLIFPISSVLLVRSQFFMPAIVSFFLLPELQSCHSNCC